MKKLLILMTCFISIPSFASLSSYIGYSSDYELLDGDIECASSINLSHFSENEVVVEENPHSKFVLAFSEINQGVSSQTYGQGGSKVCYKTEYKDGELVRYQSEYISPLRPCFLTKLQRTHSIEFRDDAIRTNIYSKQCEYVKVN